MAVSKQGITLMYLKLTSLISALKLSITLLLLSEQPDFQMISSEVKKHHDYLEKCNNNK